MADEFGARIDGSYRVVFTSPDMCKLPNGSVVPFPITEQLSNSDNYSKTTRFNGKWAFLLKSHTTKVIGDEAGVAKGVNSGTVSKKAEPIEHSKSFKIEGSPVIRVYIQQKACIEDGLKNISRIMKMSVKPLISWRSVLKNVVASGIKSGLKLPLYLYKNH